MPKFIGCSAEQKKRLIKAYESFIAYEVMTKHFVDLRKSIIRKWDSITIKCGEGNSECRGLDGAWNSQRLLICNTSTRRIGPILSHELIHACKGSELDSEVVENACFFNSGATPPTAGDFPKFCSQGTLGEERNVRISKYTIWDSYSGKVWVRIQDNDGKPIRGTLLFQSKRWKHRCK